MVFITLIISIELIGHFSYKIYKGKFLFENAAQKNLLFKEHPYLIAVPKKNFQLTNEAGDIKISTNSLGHRKSAPDSIKFKEGAIQILCLGGSSTFATGVTDEYSWPFLLQQKLGPDYKVINFGVPGYTTLEALIQLSSLSAEFNPDFIINYHGWNDLKNYHLNNEQGFYLEHGFLQRTNLKVDRKASLVDYSFMLFLAKKVSSKINSKASTKISKTQADKEVDSLYVKNLKAIKAMGNHLGAKQIFIPQLLNLDWFVQNKDNYNAWTTTISNKDMPLLITRFNQLMVAAVPTEENIITLDSILYNQQWEEDHFVDEGHFSRAGGELFSNVLISTIKQLETQKRDSL